MIKLKQIKLETIEPSSIAQDKNIQACSSAIDEQLNQIAEDIKHCLFLARIEELSDAVLDELAWQYHVDFYQNNFPREVKINLIRTSVATHRIKGTPAAVEKVCKDVFQSAKVIENWEYGGKAYSFKVKLITEAMPPDSNIITNLVAAIKNYKNTRSWLDEISFYREIKQTIYYGVAIGEHKTITIYPAKMHVPDTLQTIYYGNAMGQHKQVNINPSNIKPLKVNQNIHHGVAIGQHRMIKILSKN